MGLHHMERLLIGLPNGSWLPCDQMVTYGRVHGIIAWDLRKQRRIKLPHLDVCFQWAASSSRVRCGYRGVLQVSVSLYHIVIHHSQMLPSIQSSRRTTKAPNTCRCQRNHLCLHVSADIGEVVKVDETCQISSQIARAI